MDGVIQVFLRRMEGRIHHSIPFQIINHTHQNRSSGKTRSNAKNLRIFLSNGGGGLFVAKEFKELKIKSQSKGSKIYIRAYLGL